MWFWVFVLSIIYTEFMGYLVHRWLHKTSIAFLRDRHMEHHLGHYPPGGNMMSENYSSDVKKTWFDRVGLEWLIPISTITVPFGILLLLLGVWWQFLLSGLIIALIWTWVMFSLLHNFFHVKGIWLERNYIFQSWYKETRKLHFIHHNDMSVNYGIGFFWFDKLYETFTRKLEKK